MASSSQSIICRRMLSIDSVQIDNIVGDGKIYGEIMIEFHGIATIYRRSINNAETKLAGDFLSLTGKPYSSLTDWWTIHVSLYDGDDLHDIAVGGIYHDIARCVNVVYDKPMRRTLTGQYGAVTVNYSLITEAFHARIEAVLIDDGDDGKEEEKFGSVRVYGMIRSCTYLGEGDEEWTEMTLFGKSSAAGESAAVLPGGAIPMDRCIVGVPNWSNISVEVELWCAGDGIGAGDELVASGSVEFDEDEGRSGAAKEVSGECGRRRVRVSVHIPSGYDPMVE